MRTPARGLLVRLRTIRFPQIRLLAATVVAVVVSAPHRRRSRSWAFPIVNTWFNPSFWTPSDVPTAADNAIVNQGTAQIIGQPATAGSLILGLTSTGQGTVDISAGGMLTTTGTVVVGGLGTSTLNINRGVLGDRFWTNAYRRRGG